LIEKDLSKKGHFPNPLWLEWTMGASSPVRFPQKERGSLDICG